MCFLLAVAAGGAPLARGPPLPLPPSHSSPLTTPPSRSLLRSDAPLTGDALAPVRALLEGAVLCNDSHLVKDAGPDGKDVYTPNGAPTEVGSGLAEGLRGRHWAARQRAAQPKQALSAEPRRTNPNPAGVAHHGDTQGGR